jgi:hypothetical protein
MQSKNLIIKNTSLILQLFFNLKIFNFSLLLMKLTFHLFKNKSIDFMHDMIHLRNHEMIFNKDVISDKMFKMSKKFLKSENFYKENI